MDWPRDRDGVITGCMKPRLGMGRFLPFRVGGHPTFWQVVRRSLGVFVVLLVPLFGLVRFFTFFIRHRPIHTNRGSAEQPIIVEGLLSVRVMFRLACFT
jgi:hypothetical protein